MARIVGGVGVSHAPSIAHSFDKGLQKDPLWAPLYDGFEPAKAWLDQLKPDLMVAIYNDHMNHFFFDAYPTFALGVGDTHPQADEGWGKRNLPDLPGHAEFSWHLAQSLIEDEFDPTVCQEMTVDHGILSILPLLTDNRWPAPLVPLAANVIQHPLPTPRRLFRLGQAIRNAIESYPKDAGDETDDEVEGRVPVAAASRVRRFNEDIEAWLRFAHEQCPILAAYRPEDGESGGTELSAWHDWSITRADAVLAALGPAAAAARAAIEDDGHPGGDASVARGILWMAGDALQRSSVKT